MKAILDRLHLAALGAQARVRERRRWRVPADRSGSPRVFYGTDRLPARADVAGGGIVKVQDLAALYPNAPSGANLVYLVSSALPRQAAYLGRAARRAGARVVLNQNGVAYPAWHGRGWERVNRPMAAVLREADHVFYQSGFCKMAADLFLGERGGPWEVLYNPVDTRVFVPGDAPPDLSRPAMLCAGSHHSWYRVQAALETLAILLSQVPGARLILAGRYRWQPTEAGALEQLTQFARSLGVERSISVLGPYTQEQAPALFRSAQVLLHTKYADPCPRVVVEAMACGLPVAYSATGGVPELVGEEAGIGVAGPLDWERDHPPSPPELAAAVLAILGSYGRYAAASRARAVARYDVAPWIGRHREVFERLVGGAAGAPRAGGG